jgi:DNA replication protein DnaC
MTTNYHSETERDAQCKNCGQAFVQHGVKLWSKIAWPWEMLCKECVKIDVERRATEERERERESHEHEWASSIPWLYRDTDKAKLLPKLVEMVDRFDFQNAKGLYLSGSFGIGKTRGLTLILRNCFDDGKTVMFLNAVDLGRLFYERSQGDKATRDKADHAISRARAVNVLMIDDLGKERATERFETEMYSLLEGRCSKGKPLLVSSNYRITELAARFSEDQGGAIIRRLTEFCHAYHL